MSAPPRQTTPAERRFAFACAAVAMGLTLLPYLWAARHVPDGWRFMGFVDHPYDMFSYLMKMTDGSLGHLLRLDKYASEAQPRIYLDLFWTPLGWISWMTSLPLATVFHLARLAYGFALLVAVVPFAALFLRQPGERMLAVAFVAFASGFAFLLPDSAWTFLSEKHQILPADWWIQETVTFESLLTSPEFCADTLALLGMTGYGYAALALRRRRAVLPACLCSAVLSFIHPIDVPSGVAVLAAFAAARALRGGGHLRQSLWLVVRIGACALPGGLYLSWVFRANPVFAEWSATTFVSPNPWTYVVAFGLPLCFAAGEIVRSWRKPGSALPFLIAFVLSIAVLLYVPLVFQRRLSLGVHVPLCLLAARFAYRVLLPRLEPVFTPFAASFGRLDDAASRRRGFRIAAVCLVLATFPSNAAKLAKTAVDPSRSPAEFLLTEDEWEALTFLRSVATESDGVLCEYRLGQHVPQATRANAYLAHWSETPRFDARRRELAVFWNVATPDDSRRALLAKGRIRWLLRGPTESALGAYDPSSAPYLAKRFENRLAAVYEVVPATSPRELPWPSRPAGRARRPG